MHGCAPDNTKGMSLARFYIITCKPIWVPVDSPRFQCHTDHRTILRSSVGEH